MRRLTTIPGVGAITAASVKAMIPDPDGFKFGRHFSAVLDCAERPEYDRTDPAG
ncbi:transposase [Mesorhizobium sp. Cs1299R1N1]|uniref:transposase n=1 Tax=Mesorhizobium sp. Cs1299R1N1 TaxID=3015172 RepID=UPI00301BF78B